MTILDPITGSATITFKLAGRLMGVLKLPNQPDMICALLATVFYDTGHQTANTARLYHYSDGEGVFRCVQCHGSIHVSDKGEYPSYWTDLGSDEEKPITTCHKRKK